MFLPGVNIVARGNGHSAFRVARGSGEEQSANRSGTARLAGGETGADTSLDAARPAIQFATSQRGQPAPLLRLHQQRLCLPRPRDLTRYSVSGQVALEG